jgi:hypothetical protein
LEIAVSEVKRYDIAEYGGGMDVMVDGTYVGADDYAAAQSELTAQRLQLARCAEQIDTQQEELAALREELAVARSDISTWRIHHDCKVTERDDLQQRLADAERRNGELTSELLDRSAVLNAMQRQRDQAKDQLRRECDDIDCALKGLGLDPEQFRTDGGFLRVSKFREYTALTKPEEAKS